MNKLIIVQFLCIILIHISYEQQNFIKVPNYFDLPIRNVSKNGPLPDYVNWVERGFNTTVFEQGLCSSCYAFSALGAIEAQYFIKTGKLIKGSEQNVVDCAKPFGNRGCSGGWAYNVFDYARQVGVALDQDYPYSYNETEHTCKNLRGQKRFKVKQLYRVPLGDEKELKRIIAEVGPVSSSIDSAHQSFLDYDGVNVYFEMKCKMFKTTHAVLIVGYGTTKFGVDYWLIKNSWSPYWGDGGYMKIFRNFSNHCGIASFPVYAMDVDIVSEN